MLMNDDVGQYPRKQSIEWHHSIIDWLSCQSPALVRRYIQHTLVTHVIARDILSRITITDKVNNCKQEFNT